MSTDGSTPATNVPPAQNVILRRLLVVASVGLMLYGCTQLQSLVENSRLLRGASELPAVAYTEPVKAAIAQKLEGAKGLFQTTLVAIAVLWGLVIAKRDERVFGWRRDAWPEGTMFLIANVLFLSSAYCYTAYTDAMAAVHAVGEVVPDDPVFGASIMDFRDTRIDNLYIWQGRLWVSAMFVTAFALFSAHILRGQPEAVAKEQPKCAPAPALV